MQTTNHIPGKGAVSILDRNGEEVGSVCRHPTVLSVQRRELANVCLRRSHDSPQQERYLHDGSCPHGARDIQEENEDNMGFRCAIVYGDGMGSRAGGGSDACKPIQIQETEVMEAALGISWVERRGGAQQTDRHGEGVAPAAPYRSEEAEAAVEDALGTLSVAVSAMNTAERGIPKAVAAIWATCMQAFDLFLSQGLVLLPGASRCLRCDGMASEAV